MLARILAESIRRFIPGGGLIAFSVGHKYKTSSPNDRGAALAGGGTEADHAEKVLEKAAKLLTDEAAAPAPRTLRVMQGDRLLFETVVDEDAVVSWSSDRNLLFIPEADAPAVPRATPVRRGASATPKAGRSVVRR